MAPLNPDSYRDNEQHVDNFADHLREKAAIEQRNIVDITTEEMHRFKDVMFGVNTQHSGSQLRLRDDHGKVISKLKEDAQLKIVGNHHATIDDDGAAGNPDEHIWVEVEVDAAQTEAGGNGKIRGWVSTEYIQSLGEPEPIPVPEPMPQLIVPVAPEEKPEDWTYPEAEKEKDVPKPPEPKKPEGTTAVPDAPAAEPRESNVAVPDAPTVETKKPNAAVPDAPVTEPREPSAAVPDAPAKKPEEEKSKVPDGPKPEKEKGKQEAGKSVGWQESIKNWFLSWGNAGKKSETPAQTVEPKATDTTTPTTESGNTKKDIPVAD